MHFADVEQGRKVSKKDYRERQKPLRVELINAQFDLAGSDTGLIVLVAGDDRDGCHEVIDLIHEWMDARHIETRAFLDPTEEELAHPRFWRYWNAFPPRGRMGLLFGAWVYDVVIGRVRGELDDDAFERAIGHVRALERTLADDRTRILKLWLHTPKSVIKKRVKKLKGKDSGWRRAAAEEIVERHYDELVAAGEKLVARTDEPWAPWLVVESTDDEHRDLTVAEAIRDALLRPPTPAAQSPPPEPAPDAPRRADADLTAAVPWPRYRKILDRLQGRLSDLSIVARERDRATVLVFEGWDAAGKGGTIRRITQALAAPDYRVFPIGAPDEVERRQHWQTRFWRRLPRAGRIAIFDRSWYGRVLVERVEGFADEAAWRRAFGEIVELEAQLAEDGVLLAKFWLEVDADEQLRRFEARGDSPYKKYKLTDEDFRNRKKREAYEVAANEMLARTHRPGAPWKVVASNDKRNARIEVLRAVCAGLENALG